MLRRLADYDYVMELTSQVVIDSVVLNWLYLYAACEEYGGEAAVKAWASRMEDLRHIRYVGIMASRNLTYETVRFMRF